MSDISTSDEDDGIDQLAPPVEVNAVPKKPRRPIPKVDAELLLSPRGVDRIRKQLSSLKIKGPGHEYSDLKRLMRIFEYWADDLIPRIPFTYFIERVEKICSQRRLKMHLSQWRGEQAGILVGHEDDDVNHEQDMTPLSADKLWGDLMLNSKVASWNATVDTLAMTHEFNNDGDRHPSAVDNIDPQFQDMMTAHQINEQHENPTYHNEDDEDENILRQLENPTEAT